MNHQVPALDEDPLVRDINEIVDRVIAEYSTPADKDLTEELEHEYSQAVDSLQSSLRENYLIQLVSLSNPFDELINYFRMYNYFNYLYSKKGSLLDDYKSSKIYSKLADVYRDWINNILFGIEDKVDDVSGQKGYFNYCRTPKKYQQTITLDYYNLEPFMKGKRTRDIDVHIDNIICEHGIELTLLYTESNFGLRYYYNKFDY